jgi:hypothetical protein
MNTAPNSVSSLVVNDDPLQTKVNFFFKELQDLGVPEEGLKNIGEQLIVLTSEHLMAKISLLMDEEKFAEWQKFVDSGANEAQQALVMDKYLKEKTGKDLDTFHTEIMEELMNGILDSIREHKDLSIKIANLDDEQTKQALEYLNSEDFEKLNTLLNIN